MGGDLPVEDVLGKALQKLLVLPDDFEMDDRIGHVSMLLS
jgi:hypothetical protein